MNKTRIKIIVASAIGAIAILGGTVYAAYQHNVGNEQSVTAEASPATIVEDNSIAGPIEPDTPIEKAQEDKTKDKKEDTSKDKQQEKKEDKKEDNKSSESSKKAVSKTENKSQPKASQPKEAHKKTNRPVEHKTSKPAQTDWVAKLNVAQNTNQLVTVQASGKSAKVEFHQKDSSGIWHEKFSTNGHVGYNGITSHKREGDGSTPTGVYSLGTGFGIAGNPGTSLGYRHINNNDYWVDDVHSSHYNEWVNTSNTHKDWNSAEHMISQPVAYKYGIVVNYNSGRTPGKGSGIFIHCDKGGGTAGCVAIPQSKVVYLLQHLNSDARIVISSYDGIYNY